MSRGLQWGFAWKGGELASPESLGGQESRVEKGGALERPTETEFCSTRQAPGHRTQVRGQTCPLGQGKGLYCDEYPSHPSPSQASRDPQRLAPGQVLILT